MKKFLALLLAVLMLGSVLVACGGSGGDSKSDDEEDFENMSVAEPEDGAKLLVWAADNAQALTKELCDDFVKKYSDKNITIEVKAQGEGDAGSQVANDPDKAADVFSFACDQINDLVDRKLLLPVYPQYLDDLKANNSEFTVSAATINDEIQAFPETGENGYYLVYDKKYVKPEQAETLEGVLEACRAAKKKFVMNAGDGFFACIFPFTGGLQMDGLDEDGYQVFKEYNEDEIVDSLEAFSKLFHEYSDIFMSADCARIASGLAENPTTVAAGIDGSWNAASVEKQLGSDFGAAKLPTINVKGEDKQIISINGCKLIGVNSHSKYPMAAQALADFLTNEDSQKKRLDAIAWAPSNKAVQESDAFKNKPALVALIDQSNYALTQTNIAKNFWSPLGTLGNKIYQGDSSRAALKSEFEKAMNNILES